MGESWKRWVFQLPFLCAYRRTKGEFPDGFFRAKGQETGKGIQQRRKKIRGAKKAGGKGRRRRKEEEGGGEYQRGEDSLEALQVERGRGKDLRGGGEEEWRRRRR